MSYIQPALAATCVACSFILAGNAITQTYLTIPALCADFPAPGTAEHANRARLLGKQWPYCWAVGNVFFRPMSTVSTIAYAYTAYCAYPAEDIAKRGLGATIDNLPSAVASALGDWRAFAVAALLGVGTIVHSAVNMQPMNDRLAALAGAGEKSGGTVENAEALARRWGRWNLVRVVFPVIGGGLALSQLAG